MELSFEVAAPYAVPFAQHYINRTMIARWSEIMKTGYFMLRNHVRRSLSLCHWSDKKS